MASEYLTGLPGMAEEFVLVPICRIVFNVSGNIDKCLFIQDDRVVKTGLPFKNRILPFSISPTSKISRTYSNKIGGILPVIPILHAGGRYTEFVLKSVGH